MPNRFRSRLSFLVLRSLLLMVLAAWLPGAHAAAPAWSMGLSAEGLPVVRLGGVPVMQAGYAFWGEQWRWSAQTVKVARTGELSRTVEGRVEALGLSMSADVQARDPRVLSWQWRYDAANALSNVVGGGISFKFDLGATATEMGPPELLPGGAGWRWGKPGAERFEMRFQPAPASVYFERGNPREIRVMFYRDRIPAQPLQIQATWMSSGAVKHAEDPASQWSTGETDWPRARDLDATTWPLDLSFLNARDKPAGRRGWVQARGERLVFGDGSTARFWGTNLTAYALFNTPRHEVPGHARRLSALGYNLVRLHHHDSVWVAPNIFGRKPTSSRELDPAQAEKIDWWIKCLKDEGIYLWLDLHVGRHMYPDDGMEAFAEVSKGKPSADIKGVSYVNPSVQAAMQRFAADYLGRINSETGLKAVDDPAVAFIQITNENDVTHHFGNLLLADKGVPWHHARFAEAARRFASTSGLPYDKLTRTWEPGPSKYLLNDLEYRFNAAALAHLRSLGVKAVVSTTSTWGYNPTYSLPALTVGDAIDAHAYDNAGWLERDPRVGANLLHWLQAAKVSGKPSTVSEWNIETPRAYDRHTLPLFASASAAHQGVSAMLHYAYSQGNFELARGRLSPWDSNQDPALLLSMTPAALIYRLGLVEPARVRHVWRPSASELFNEAASPGGALALRTAGELGHLSIAMPAVKELPWLRPSPAVAGEKALASLQASPVPLSGAEVRSDTGELWRNAEHGMARIDAPAAQALMGRTGGHPWTTRDVEARLNVPVAALAVVTPDGQPVAKAATLLVSASGRVDNPSGQLPWLTEPVGGSLRIRSEQDREVRALRTDGTPHTFKVRSVQGWVTLNLSEIPGQGGLALRLEAAGR